MMRLGSRQVRCLDAKLSARQREADEALETEARYREERLEAYTDAIEPWVGPLSTGQGRALAKSVDSRGFARRVATARRRATRRFVALLSLTDESVKRARLRSAVRERHALYTDRERALMRQRDDRRRERIWAVARSLTTKQRARLRARLLSYAEDFEELSRQRTR